MSQGTTFVHAPFVPGHAAWRVAPRGVQVLLVSHDPLRAARLVEILKAADAPYHATWLPHLTLALALLHLRRVEIVLFDTTLPGQAWQDALEHLAIAAPDALRVAITATEGDAAAREAQQHGVHQTIAMSRLDAYWLPRLLDMALHLSMANTALADSEALFGAMHDASPLGTFITDARGKCLYSNAAFQRISGQALRPGTSLPWHHALHPDDRPGAVQEWRKAVEAGVTFHTEARLLRPDGSTVWIRMNAAQIPSGPSRHGYVHTVEDITRRKRDEAMIRAAEEALHIERERAQVTLNSIGDAVISTDTDCRVTYLNRVAETMTGWTQDHALGRPLSEIFKVLDGKTHLAIVDPARRAIQENHTVGLAMDSILIRRDGSELPIEDSAAPIHDRTSRITGAVIVFHPASQSLIVTNRMSHLAQHDALTGLPNRVLLEERLSRAIGLAQRHQQQVALLFIDLDDFKAINDRLGHAAGDALLQSIARRLEGCVRDTDTVCRLGGDEFVILLTEVHGPHDADLVADTIIRSLAPPHQLDQEALTITASLGISLYPENGSSAEDLMRRADTAMYHTKRHGGNSYRFISNDMMAGHEAPGRATTGPSGGQESGPRP